MVNGCAGSMIRRGGQFHHFPDSVLLWDENDGSVYEATERWAFRLRGRWPEYPGPSYEFSYDVIEEVSLVDCPANPHAVIALVK
jgi:hypothetical protein